jgi:hypothetical protein
MKKCLLGIALTAALSTTVALANARPLAMSDVQLDRVTAGSFGQVYANGSGVSFNITGYITAVNTNSTSGSATAYIMATDITALGVPPNTATLATFASAP